MGNDKQQPPAITLRQQDSSASSVYDALVALIADGELRPGEWLREEAVSKLLGTSRTPVREALRSLAADGLVELVHNRGARVRNWSSAQIVETYSLRAVLEGFAARQASERRRPDAVAQLRSVQDELEAALEARAEGYLDRVAELNAEFHRTVLKMADSPLLEGFVETLSSLPLVRRAFRGYTEADLLRTIVSHRDIIRGIETSSADLAEAAMRGHILAAASPASNALHLEDQLSGDTQPPNAR